MYFYSTDYLLSDAQAKALAEWESVERRANMSEAHMYDYADHGNIDFSDTEPPKHDFGDAVVRDHAARGISTRSIPKSTWTCTPSELSNWPETVRRAGIPEGCNAASMTGMSKRGERAIQLFCVIDEDGLLIKRAGFRCRGDIATIASASLITALIEGKTVDEALDVSVADLKRELGKMPADRVTRPYLAVEAVRAMVGDFFLRQGREDLAWLDANLACDEFGVNCSMCEHCSLRDQRVSLRFGK